MWLPWRMSKRHISARSARSARSACGGAAAHGGGGPGPAAEPRRGGRHASAAPSSSPSRRARCGFGSCRRAECSMTPPTTHSDVGPGITTHTQASRMRRRERSGRSKYAPCWADLHRLASLRFSRHPSRLFFGFSTTSFAGSSVRDMPARRNPDLMSNRRPPRMRSIDRIRGS
jgi:hypothetical protein